MSTKTVNIKEAQHQFSELLTFALEGNEVVIIEDNNPLARLVPIITKNQQRIPGLNEGTIWTSDDFDTLLSV